MKYLLAIVLTLNVGCATAGPPVWATTTVNTAEVAVEAADKFYAPMLEKAIADAQSLSADLREAQLHPYMVGAEILLRADQAARTARVAMDTWQDVGTAKGTQLVACLVVRLQELETVLHDLGVPVPSQLTQALQIGSSFAQPLCGDQ